MHRKKPFIQNRPSQKKIDRAEHEQCYRVAKKLLRHFDLDPNLIDVFTKNQKLRLLHHFYKTPFVKPLKEKTVPRQYIRNISNTVIQFMKENYWGDPENKLSYMELATFGLSFLSNIEQVYREDGFTPDTMQYDAAAKICAKFDRDEVLNTAFNDVQYEIWYLTRSYSRVNYRMYGFEMGCEEFPRSHGNGSDYKVSFRLTAQESESKNFVIHNIVRKAYRMFETSDGLYFPKPMQLALYQNRDEKSDITLT